MTPKIKNIIIVVVVVVVLVLIYIFFINKTQPQADLISNPSTSGVVANSTTDQTASTTNDNFLSLLLDVNSIKLDDSIFSDPAFINLHDSSITLIPDGTQGRPNPFAPIGSDGITTPASTTSATTPPNGSTPPPITQ
jgi:cytoskeletal protein RodZ